MPDVEDMEYASRDPAHRNGEAVLVDRIDRCHSADIAPDFNELSCFLRRLDDECARPGFPFDAACAAKPGFQVEGDIAINLHQLAYLVGADDFAIDIKKDDRLTGIAIYCGENVRRLAHRDLFPTAAKGWNRNNIMRKSQIVEV